ALLASSGYQVKTDRWHDPRIAIVHDVVLPIPLYYLQPVVEEIEDAYLRLAADEKRPYHLHTDFHWEKTLPNLNPRRSEVSVDWSLRMLAEALVARVVAFAEGQWRWRLSDEAPARELGSTLSSALYRLSEIHRKDDLRRRFGERLGAARAALDPAREAERRKVLTERLDGQIERIALRELDGEHIALDVLDRPILRALRDVVRDGGSGADGSGAVAVESTGGVYDDFGFDD
ncbi:MAG: hypothetical protein AAGE94_15985, partial [Acidobacteriota bacterium]